MECSCGVVMDRGSDVPYPARDKERNGIEAWEDCNRIATLHPRKATRLGEALCASIVGGKQNRDGAAFVILDEPERFRLRRVLKHLKVVQSGVHRSISLQVGQTGKDLIAIRGDRCGCGHERL